MTNPPPSQLLLIFGASGDLTHRKLLPALYTLFCEKLLPKRFLIIGTARTEQSTEQYRYSTQTAIAQHCTTLDFASVKEFLHHIYYITANPLSSTDFNRLFHEINQLRHALDIDNNILFYLATPPTLYSVITTNIITFKQNRQPDGWRRIIIEKPFGNNGREAAALDYILRKGFDEKEIFRIDHFLAKETVQNILALRFANEIWEPAWNEHYIDHITLTATETAGVEKRGKYYDNTGALRDMIQNHLLQILAFITMETPVAFTSDAIRNETAKLLQSIRPFSQKDFAHNIVRGQYAEGIYNSKTIPGYRNEPHVSSTSVTETFVAMRCYIDNRRWYNTPIYLITGKRLIEKRSEAVIYFRRTPHQLFPQQCAGEGCNRLIMRLAPDEGIDLQFGLKHPGDDFAIEAAEMRFDYDTLEGYTHIDAYRRLLLDAMKGISLLYARSDSLLASWHFIDPIIEYWQKSGNDGLQPYPAGSVAPLSARELCPDITSCSYCHKNTSIHT